MNYNDKLKWIRNSQKISQKQIADVLNIKQQQYSRYEKGTNVMPITYLIEICKFLDISADYILGLNDEIKSYNYQ